MTWRIKPVSVKFAHVVGDIEQIKQHSYGDALALFSSFPPTNVFILLLINNINMKKSSVSLVKTKLSPTLIPYYYSFLSIELLFVNLTI